MSTTSEKLTSIINSKDAIKTAIEAKGVTVGDALLEDYADLIEDIPTGGSSSSAEQNTVLYMDFNGDFDAEGELSLMRCKGTATNEMDYQSEPWGGNFTSDATFGNVLTFPEQDIEESPWECAGYAVNYPINAAKLVALPEFTVEFWFRYQGAWNTYSSGSILGATDSYGGGLDIGFVPNQGFYYRCLGVGPQRAAGTINIGWNHLALQKTQGHFYFYTNGVSIGGEIEVPASPSSSYVPKELYIGFNSTSDYKRYSVAKLRISRIARYSGDSFTPSTSYTAD